MAINKVVYGGNTLIDLTETTATSSTIIDGYTAFGADGNLIRGTNPGTQILSNTVEGWNSIPSLISEKNVLYIYTNHSKDAEGNNIAGAKIGDGLAYLIDLPFISADMYEHMTNDDIHVTQAEKAFWNSKIRGYISSDNEENLILTTD